MAYVNEKITEIMGKKTMEIMEILKNSNEENDKMIMNIIRKCLNTSKGNMPSFNENEKMFIKKEIEEDENDNDITAKLKKVGRYFWKIVGIYD